MKKIYYALMCIAALTLTATNFSSCGLFNIPSIEEPEDPEEPENPDEPQDPENPDDPETPDDPMSDLYDYDKLLQKIKPGVYEIHMDDTEEVAIIARSTDDWYFCARDIKPGRDIYCGKDNFLPKGLCWTDGQNNLWDIKQWWKGEGNLATGVTYSPRFYRNHTEWATREALLADAEIHSILGNLLFVSHAVKVLDGMDGDAMLQAIINKYKTGEVPAFESMMVNVYCGNGFGWQYDKYPQDLNTAGYVIPFTDNGTVKSFSVVRDATWPASIIVLYPAEDDHVCRVEATIECSADEARKYIDTIKKDGHIVRILTDSDSEGVIGFSADEWWEEGGPTLPEDVRGYFSCSYTVIWVGGQMELKCEIVYTGFV